jgi:hypothetical protein
LIVLSGCSASCYLVPDDNPLLGVQQGRLARYPLSGSVWQSLAGYPSAPVTLLLSTELVSPGPEGIFVWVPGTVPIASPKPSYLTIMLNNQIL